MRKQLRFVATIAMAVLISTTLATAAAGPAVPEDEVTDFGRTPNRTHYTPAEPEYPRSKNAQPYWEVPLGLSRSQPLVIRRDVAGNGQTVTRIFHLAGDRLWALDGDMQPTPMQAGQSVANYRQQLVNEKFIRWSTPATALCASNQLQRQDDLLAIACSRVSGIAPDRPFASSQAAYVKGARPDDDVIYVGFGYPAALVAIRAKDGQVLGGYVVDGKGDRGIVGAPLVFPGDTVVIGTTSGEAYIVQGLATGTARVRGLAIGGRISFSPVPLGPSGFLMGSDARYAADLGSHGYLMAYGLGGPAGGQFSPKWPSAVVTDSGIPGEAAIDAQTVYFADKHGKLFALKLDTGELMWCRQFPGMGACTGGDSAPAFINNGPGVDENQVYFVFHNDQGPNQGTGHIVALNKATGELLWQQPMDFMGNTAPVPMG
jgi:outer membrane protein assembly factor BamB